jgi:type VI secretion system protein VasG
MKGSTMADISRAVLFGKLNPLAFRAMESAATFCKLRGNPYVEIAHWLHQVLQVPDSDLHRIVRHFALDPSILARDLTEALDRLPRGSTSITDISSQLEEAVERGWVYGSLLFDAAQVRGAHLVVGALKTPSLRNAWRGISREFDKVRLDEFVDGFATLLEGSPESSHLDAAPQAPFGPSSVSFGKQDALQRFTVDLTDQARSGTLDPIVGRDEEIRQVIDILMRRRQNNPLLTGEAGVGKTAVVEGLAQRIVSGDVPPALRDVSLRTLDVALLQAGAGMKGEFESRLKQVLEEVQAAERPVILFIDEAHTLVGAGGSAGTGDAANLLKPALARGTVRTVAATTWSEYRRHIEKDPALTRRFQVVQVREPDEARAISMMRGIVAALEQHHGVQVLDEAIEAAVRLSHRYIPARQLPDKSVSLLDTACARVAVSQHATPPALDDARKRIATLRMELGVIERERAIGIETAARQASVMEALDAETTRLADLESRWTTERELVNDILERRAALREGAPGADLDALRARQIQLAQYQAEAPLILPAVDRQAVAAVVQDWTGVPVLRMVKNEIDSVLRLAEHLDRRVVGQEHATAMIARRIQTSRAGLDDPDKPVGVFMLAGTSGVGKTETALALAELLYGGEQNLITINMSEYQEAHTVSLLKGAPPGYVGFGEGGVLTEAVRRRPYSVVLLDEVEKAHPDVHELFFQVFDKGWMEDSEGRAIDFRNTLILLTTNAGAGHIAQLQRDAQRMPAMEAVEEQLHATLLDTFPAALLGRLVVIPYYPLSETMLHTIIRLQLQRVEQRVVCTHQVPFTYDDSVVDLIAARCTRMASGGRMIDAILTNTLLPRISTAFLSRVIDGRSIEKVHVAVADSEFTYAFE